MAINISFPLFTDEEILWADKDSVNSFFQSVTVPAATTTSEGVAKKASLPSALADSVTMVYYTLNIYNDDGTIGQALDVTSKATGNNIITMLNDLQTQVNSIRSAMITAGQGE